MKEGQSSRTAEYMALFRALESVRPADVRLFDDPFAVAFLNARHRAIVAASRIPWIGNLVLAAIDRRWPGSRTAAVARTRYIDDEVVAALEAGLQQAALLGAGFDSRAYRIAALAGVNVFEVDHPSTSTAKRRAISSTLGRTPANVQFVPIDFNVDSLPGAMAMGGFSPRRPTLVVWEGVSNYLTLEGVDATLRWCASLPAGSTLIFTYVHQRVFDAPKAFDGTERLFALLAAAGEQWTFGLDPAELRNFLARRGLALDRDCGSTECRAKYFGRNAMKMTGSEFHRIAVARVVRGPAPAPQGESA